MAHYASAIRLCHESEKNLCIFYCYVYIYILIFFEQQEKFLKQLVSYLTINSYAGVLDVLHPS